jgi:hypothetical protein
LSAGKPKHDSSSDFPASDYSLATTCGFPVNDSMTNRWIPISAGLLACALATHASTPLPDTAPGPFAPIPDLLTGPALPTKPMEPKAPILKDCANAPAILEKLHIQLTNHQTRTLDANRFLLIPIQSTALGEICDTDQLTKDEMLHAFSLLGGDLRPGSLDQGQARLVTPDTVLHAWHCGFARTLEYIEQNQLHGILATFLEGALANARELRARSGEPAATKLAWTEARFAAAWVLLGPPSSGALHPSSRSSYDSSAEQRLAKASENLPPAIADALSREIHLILDAKAIALSPLFGISDPDNRIDYTRFKPRSHYTKNDELGGYFRAMTFLGCNGYDMRGPEAIRDALLASLVMARTPEKGISPLKSWKELMEITGFFAGQSDDITYPELRAWTADNLGPAPLDINSALSPDNLAKLFANISKLRPPLIVSPIHQAQTKAPDSAPPSFRIFGQRFSWDARILDRLTCGAPDQMPSVPSCVTIPAAFGDSYAEKLSRAQLAALPGKGKEYAAEFDKRLPEIRKELTSVGDNEWFASMASKQLHVISTLARPRNEFFPAFMRNEAFLAKNIASMLGSFTELKHDTVLYEKEKGVFETGGDELGKRNQAQRGFVQPDLVFWREMERLSIFAADGFDHRIKASEGGEISSRYRAFAKAMTEFRKIAEKEIAGEKLSQHDQEIIRTTDLLGMACPTCCFCAPKPGDGKCALAADVLTDADSGQILQEALGRPYVMLALVGGQDGNRMVVGLAYNHFEFTRRLDQGRLTDEEWKDCVYGAKPTLPAKAAWQSPGGAPDTGKQESGH